MAFLTRAAAATPTRDLPAPQGSTMMPAGSAVCSQVRYRGWYEAQPDVQRKWHASVSQHMRCQHATIKDSPAGREQTRQQRRSKAGA